MVEPGWIDFYTAAATIRKRFDTGWAEAKARLRSACADGKIVSMKAPYDPDQLPKEYWTDVAHRDWRDREVDDDGPDADGCKVVVMLHEDDFRRWLSKEPKLPDSPRNFAIHKLLKAGAEPPRNMPWKTFCKRVRDDAGGWTQDKPARSFSNKQIQRAVKEIKPVVTKRPKNLTLSAEQIRRPNDVLDVLTTRRRP
jgi:hypothetical protein